MVLKSLLVTLILLLVSCYDAQDSLTERTWDNPADAQNVFASYQDSNFVDERDSLEYRTMRVGNLRWLASDLLYGENSQGAYSWFKTMQVPEIDMQIVIDSTNMPNPQGNCPLGWQVPSLAQWQDLFSHLQMPIDSSFRVLRDSLAFSKAGLDMFQNFGVSGYWTREDAGRQTINNPYDTQYVARAVIFERDYDSQGWIQGRMRDSLLNRSQNLAIRCVQVLE